MLYKLCNIVVGGVFLFALAGIVGCPGGGGGTSLTGVAPPQDAWFQQNIASKSQPVLVKFGAEWCGPCRMMDPELDRLAAGSQGKYSIVRVNVDENPGLASHYQISSIPRVVLFENGQVVADRLGFAGHQELKTWIEANAGR